MFVIRSPLTPRSLSRRSFYTTPFKSLASAVLSNPMQSALSTINSVALATALSFTGIGNTASSLIMAALDYSVIVVGSILHLKIRMIRKFMVC